MLCDLREKIIVCDNICRKNLIWIFNIRLFIKPNGDRYRWLHLRTASNQHICRNIGTTNTENQLVINYFHNITWFEYEPTYIPRPRTFCFYQCHAHSTAQQHGRPRPRQPNKSTTMIEIMFSTSCFFFLIKNGFGTLWILW